MAQQIIAVDVSPRALRVVRLETSLRSAAVASVETIPMGDQERAQALRALRDKLPEHVDSIVVSVDERAASTRALRFPFGDLRKVEAAVDFELEGQVPYDLDDTARTWHVTARSGNSTEVLAALTPKKALLERLTELSAVDLEPRAVLLAASGLVELVPQSQDPVAIVSLGDTATHVAVARAGLRMARTLRAGGADVDRAIAKAYNLDLPTARDAKEREGRVLVAAAAASAEERKISDTVVAGLGPLVTGLATTFKSLAAADAPQRLYLTGGLSRLPGIAEYLAARLSLPVELLDLATAIPAPAQGPGRPLSKPVVVPPEAALALGMALAVLRHGRGTALNFRRGEFAYQGDLQLYRGQVMRIAVGLSAVILLAIAGAVVRYSMISAEETRLNAAFCDATKKIVGREICDPTAALATLRSAPGSGDGVVIPPYSAAALLEMMSKSIDPSVDVAFEELELRVDGRAGEPDRVTGKGEAASFDATEQIVSNLKRDPCVQEAEVSKQKKTRDGGRVEFNIMVKVACPAGVRPGATEMASAAPPPTPTPGAPPLPDGILGGPTEEP